MSISYIYIFTHILSTELIVIILSGGIMGYFHSVLYIFCHTQEQAAVLHGFPCTIIIRTLCLESEESWCSVVVLPLTT